MLNETFSVIFKHCGLSSRFMIVNVENHELNDSTFTITKQFNSIAIKNNIIILDALIMKI